MFGVFAGFAQANWIRIAGSFVYFAYVLTSIPIGKFQELRTVIRAAVV